MQAVGPLSALESSPIASAMRHELWLYPAVEVAHITGFVVLVGSIVVLDLRLLGVSRRLPVRSLTRHVLPWSFAALLLIVPTGLLMFMAHASDFLVNRAFQLKLGLILFAAVNAALFHTGVYRTVAQWDVNETVPAPARFHAAASLALWFGVLACGRLLAYV
jgi:hypothetical protein